MHITMRWTAVALLLAGLQLTSPGGAADLDALMREFNVSPAGLKPASTFSLKSLEGRTVTLAEQRGRTVLLYFWATW
jgi:hypothetical protein